MSDKVYIVTSGSYSDYTIERVYLDLDEAQRFVDAYNGTLERRYQFTCSDYQIEEFTVGAGPVEMDGPIWEGTWRYSQVEKPSEPDPDFYEKLSGPRYYEMFAPREYTGEWRDSFEVHEVWHTGPTPPKAEVTLTRGPGSGRPGTGFMATVRGTSRDHVEKSLQDTAARLKAERAGL